MKTVLGVTLFCCVLAGCGNSLEAQCEAEMRQELNEGSFFVKALIKKMGSEEYMKTCMKTKEVNEKIIRGK